SFSVAGGQTKTVTLHLSAKARSLLAKLHVIPSRAPPLGPDPARGNPPPPAPEGKGCARQLRGPHEAPRQHIGGGAHAAPPSGTGAPAQAVVTVARPVIRSAGIGRM